LPSGRRRSWGVRFPRRASIGRAPLKRFQP